MEEIKVTEDGAGIKEGGIEVEPTRGWPRLGGWGGRGGGGGGGGGVESCMTQAGFGHWSMRPMPHRKSVAGRVFWVRVVPPPPPPPAIRSPSAAIASTVSLLPD